MKKNIFFPLTILLIILTLSANILAQEVRGEIQGTIRDPQGAVIPNVTITITGVDVGFTRTETTDEQGFYRSREVPPGIYTVAVAATGGFAGQTKQNVRILIGNATTVDFDLAIGTGTAVVDVQAEGGAATVDVTETRVQENITREEIETLPKGTTFSSLLRTTASTRVEPLSGQFQVNGGSGAENSFVVDGQEVTNFRTGALNTNNDIPYQFVQEVQVKSSGFEAEFGGATGGVVSVVTRSGTNEFHGEFGLQFVTSKLNARPRPVLVNTLTGTGDTGQFVEYFQPAQDSGTNTFPVASLSGPIIKDKVWFFGIYAPQYLVANRTQNFVTGFGPTRRPITETDLPVFLRGRGLSEPQQYNVKQTNQYSFLRLDANPTENIRLTGSFTYNPIIQRGLFAGGAGITSAFQPAANSTLIGTPSFGEFGGSTGLLAGAQLAALQGGRQNSNNTRFEAVWSATNNFIATFRYTHGFLNERLGSYFVPNTTRFRCRTGGATFCGATGFQNTTNNSQIERDASTRDTFDVLGSYLTSGFLGNHEFRAGYQFLKIRNEVNSGYANTGVANLYYGQTSFNNFNCAGFTTPANITTILPANQLAGVGCLVRFGTRGEASNRNQAIFVQDKWQPTSRLTINLGVRAEQENLPAFNGQQTNLKFSFMDKIAPRLGAAYDLTGDGKTKIGVFYGWFYDRLKFELPRGSFGGDFYRVDFFEIPTANSAYTNFTPATVIGSFGDPIGGACPSGGLPATTAYLTRCQVDFRVPSNLQNLVLANGAPLQPGAVDPDLKPFRQSEFTVEFQRELKTNSVLTARYLFRNVDSAVEDAGFLTPTGSEFYIISNPCEGLYLQRSQELGIDRCAKPQRRYDALQVEYDTRLTSRLNLNLNYTFSRLYGNYSGLASSDEPSATGTGRLSPGVNRFFDLPFVGFTATGQPDNGRLATDRPHVFKASGNYNFNWWNSTVNSTDFAFFTTVQSGSPITTFVNVFGLLIPETERGDLGRTETFTQTDLNLTHRIRFGRDNRFSVAFDFNVLNVFNEHNILFVSNNRTSGFYALGYEEVVPTAPGETPNFVQAFNTLLSQGVRTQLNQSIAADPGFNLEQSYGLPSVFQTPRSIRFGFRLNF